MKDPKGTGADGQRIESVGAASGPQSGAMSKVRVIELASMVAGPFCARILADLGARVTKVEPPRTGERARYYGPFANDVPDSGRSLLFEYLNSNKSGVTLNVEKPTGVEIFRRLVGLSDLLIEDTPPGYLESLGLGWGDLVKVNPQLAMVSITPFGQYGKYARYRAYGMNTAHISVMGSLLPTGMAWRMHPDREPLSPGGNFVDYHVGMTAAVGTMVLLFAQSQGFGAHRADVSKQECVLHVVRPTLGRYANLNVLETGKTLDYRYGGTVPCRDGFIQLHIQYDVHWHAFVQMLGAQNWANDPKFNDASFRATHPEEINHQIYEWSKGQDREDIYRECLKHGVPAVPFLSPLEVLNTRQLAATEYYQNVDHPRLGRIRCATLPYRTERGRFGVRQVAPAIGEHNRQVYCDILGWPEEDLPKLCQTGII